MNKQNLIPFYDAPAWCGVCGNRAYVVRKRWHGILVHAVHGEKPVVVSAFGWKMPRVPHKGKVILHVLIRVSIKHMQNYNPYAASYTWMVWQQSGVLKRIILDMTEKQVFIKEVEGGKGRTFPLGL